MSVEHSHRVVLPRGFARTGIDRSRRVLISAARIVALLVAWGVGMGTALPASAQGAPTNPSAQPTPQGALQPAVPSGPASDANDPLSADVRDAILAEETRAIRAVAADADGFIDRMQTWTSASETVQGFSAGLTDIRPVLDQLGNVRTMGQLGLLDMLAQNDDDMAQLIALLDGVAGAVEVIDTLDQLSAPLATLGGGVEGLLARPTLSETELSSLRASLPEGAAALERASEAYARLAPTLDAAFERLDEVEADVRKAMKEFGPMLGTDAGRQLSGLVDMVFDETRALKDGLDDMAERVDTDVETLAAIEVAIVEAEAHLAFARADALVAVDLAAAKTAFAAVVDNFAGTSWAEKAQSRLDAGVTKNAESSAALRAPDAGDGSTAMWIGGGFLLFGLLMCIGLVVHARFGGRDERPDEPAYGDGDAGTDRSDRSDRNRSDRNRRDRNRRDRNRRDRT